MQVRIPALVLLLMTAAVAGAAQFQAFDRAEQIRASNVILKGRVISVRSDWDETASMIYSFADVAVDEVWKGLPETDHVLVRTPGGTIGDVGLAVDGAAHLAEGERVVLFLARRSDVYEPVGMIFGKYAVEDSGPREFLIGNLPPSVTGAQRFEVVSIATDDLRQEVRRILEEQAP